MMAESARVQEPDDVKPHISTQERRSNVASARLNDLLSKKNPKSKPTARAALSAVKRAKMSQRRKPPAKKSVKVFSPKQPSDSRNCEHKDIYLVWESQEEREHVWQGARDMDKEPTKKTALKNMIYCFSRMAADHNKSKTYSQWVPAWAFAVKNLSEVTVNQTPRSFKDDTFPFVYTEVLPYSCYSVDATFFKETIIGDDFVYGNDQSNPGFKTRLAQLVQNVVWMFICKTCTFYARTTIKTEAKDKQLLPFVRMHLDCECGICNLRLYVIFKSQEANSEGNIEFEVFVEQRRSVSVVAQNFTVDNSTRTFVAGRCGQCVVQDFVERLDAPRSTLKEIYKHASIGTRPGVKHLGADREPNLIDQMINCFDVMTAVMRNNHDKVGHKLVLDTDSLSDLFDLLGIGQFPPQIYFTINTGFREMKLAKVPYLDDGILECFTNHEPKFMADYAAYFGPIRRAFSTVIQALYPMVEWSDQKHDVLIKREVILADDEERARRVPETVNIADEEDEQEVQSGSQRAIEVKQEIIGEEETVRCMGDDDDNDPSGNNAVSVMDQLAGLEPSRVTPGLPSILVAPQAENVSPETEINDQLMEEESEERQGELEERVTVRRPTCVQELLSTPLAHILVPLPLIKGTDDKLFLTAEDVYIAEFERIDQ